MQRTFCLQGTLLPQDSEGVETDFDAAVGFDNSYGAAGSSACLSDTDIRSIQAPLVRNPAGRPRQNRFPRMFERFKKGSKRKSGSVDGLCLTPFILQSYLPLEEEW
jgi:hypothetical protein